MELTVLILVLLTVLNFINFRIAFWIAVGIFIDPGGYFHFYFDLMKLTFLLPFFIAFMPIIATRNIKLFPSSDYYKPIKYFLPFLIYLIAVYFLINNKEDLNTLKSYLYLGVYCNIFILIPLIYNNAFHITVQKPKLPFIILGIYGSIVGVLYMFSLISGADLLYVKTANRFGLTRYITYQYGNYLFTPFVFLAFHKIEEKKTLFNCLIILTGTLGIVIYLLDMSRGRYISMALTLLLMYGIRYYIGLTLKSSTMVIIVIAFTVVFLFQNHYVRNITRVFEDSYVTVVTGRNIQNKKEIRFTKDMPIHLKFFYKNPFWGFGYKKKWYSNAIGDYGASDSPFSAGLGMTGIFGYLLYLYFVFGLLYFLYKKINEVKSWQLKSASLDFSILYIIFSIVMAKFILFPYWFQEIIRPQVLFVYYIFIAIGMANFYSLKQNVICTYDKRRDLEKWSQALRGRNPKRRQPDAGSI